MVSIPLRQAKNCLVFFNHDWDIILFQFLLGRLKTEKGEATTVAELRFQFLLGRLKTWLQKSHRKENLLGFNSS